MEIVKESPQHEDGKINRLFEGPLETFPGNATLSQFFQSGFVQGGVIDPTSTALIDEEVTHTFQQLDEQSSKVAEAIRTLFREHYKNLNPDQDVVIGVCMPPSDKLIMAMFAIEKLGAAYLPFEVSFPEDRVIKIVKESRPILIISDNHSYVVSKFDTVKDLTKIITSGEIFKMASEVEATEEKLKKILQFPSNSYGAERTAIVLYTSGSSGQPKGVRISHRSIMNRLHWQWKTFPFEKTERCIFKTSLTFVDSVAEIFGPLLQGRSLTILAKQFVSNPSVFIQKLDLYKVTRLVLVPSLLKAIFQTIKVIGADAQDMLNSVKLWVCSGETMTKNLIMEFFEVFPRGYTICNFYGSTEIMGDVTYISFSSKQDIYMKSLENHVPIGEPIFNTVIYVLNNEMELCDSGELGALYVGGYNLAKGYVGTPDHPSFITNPFSKTVGYNRLYKTGDYGKITETPGKLRTIAYEGRVDSQIKIRGQRVDLSEIEMIMGGIDLIAKSKVLCYHPGLDDQAIIAFIVPANDVHFDRIKGTVNNRLREYERPILRVIEDIPLLVNGKTDRQRLLQIYEQEIENRAGTASVDWTSLDLQESKIPVAKLLVKTISEVTGASIVDLSENLNNSFFNMGGSSLNSIVVIMKLREQKCLISIPDFVSANTIRDIIENAYIMSDEEEEQDPGLSVYDKAELLYQISHLTDEDKDEVCSIIAHSFAHHGDLEEYTDATYDDFIRLIGSIWTILVEKGLSFVVRRKEGNKAVGVSLNFDVYDEPSEVEASQGIEYVLEMLEFIESRQREKLPKGKGKLVHSFMMGTPEEIDKSENVFVIQYMEEKVLRMAEEKNFYGVMTTNTNVLTQQIARDIHGYETLSEYQVNHYVAPDGKKPFKLAPDTFKIVCCWKTVGDHRLNAEDKFFRPEDETTDGAETPNN